MLNPLADTILFTFTDDVVGGQFVSTAASGIVTYRNYNEGLSRPRWGRAIAVGPKVESEIKAGTLILIEPLQWTEGFTHDGVKIWKTTADKVLGIPKED